MRMNYMLKGFNFAKKLVIAFAVLACMGMWGCGIFDEEVTHVVNVQRSGGFVIAILDDSLALEFNGRGWTDHTESCDYWDNCDRGMINQGLFLVNYREKQKPLWGDTINGVIAIIWGLAADSTVLFYDEKNNFGFWKVDKFPENRKQVKFENECAWNDPYTRAKPWLNGNVLLKDMYPCPYAVLDTATGVVSKLEFTGEYAWLEGCDDIAYIDGDVVCLRQRGDRLCEIDFEKGGIVIDSLVKSEWMLFEPPVIYGNGVVMESRSFDKNDHAYDFGDRVILLEKNGFKREYPETWLRYHNFIDSRGNSISYSSEDLIVTR